MSAVHRQFYDVCGTRLVIESDVDQVLERVAMTYAAYAQTEDGGPDAVTVSARTRNGSVEVRDSAGRRAAELTDHADGAAAALERIARVLTLALADRQLLAVHAAAVVWRGGAL